MSGPPSLPRHGSTSGSVAIVGVAIILSVMTRTSTYAAGVSDTSCIGAWHGFNCVTRWGRLGDPSVRLVPEPGEEEKKSRMVRDRRWLARCRPVVEYDHYGVARCRLRRKITVAVARRDAGPSPPSRFITRAIDLAVVAPDVEIATRLLEFRQLAVEHRARSLLHFRFVPLSDRALPAGSSKIRGWCRRSAPDAMPCLPSPSAHLSRWHRCVSLEPAKRSPAH